MPPMMTRSKQHDPANAETLQKAADNLSKASQVLSGLLIYVDGYWNRHDEYEGMVKYLDSKAKQAFTMAGEGLKGGQDQLKNRYARAETPKANKNIEGFLEKIPDMQEDLEELVKVWKTAESIKEKRLIEVGGLAGIFNTWYEDLKDLQQRVSKLSASVNQLGRQIRTSPEKYVELDLEERMLGPEKNQPAWKEQLQHVFDKLLYNGPAPDESGPGETERMNKWVGDELEKLKAPPGKPQQSFLTKGLVGVLIKDFVISGYVSSRASTLLSKIYRLESVMGYILIHDARFIGVHEGVLSAADNQKERDETFVKLAINVAGPGLAPMEPEIKKGKFHYMLIVPDQLKTENYEGQLFSISEYEFR